MNHLLFMCLVYCCLFHGGVSQNSEVSCPPTFYKEGPSILQLTIVNSTFSVCDIGPTTVTCRWAPTNGLERIICSSSVTRCERDVVSLRCPCVQESGQGFKYSFNFSMLTNQEQGRIYCDLDCTVLSGGPKATVNSSEQCSDITFVSKCVRNGPCKHGTCEIDENDETFCDCTGTQYKGDHCDDIIKEIDIIIGLGCAVVVAVVIILLCIVVIFRLLWKTLFSCVICVIVCVDETKKKTLHTVSTKRKVEDFVSEHFIMHCCCCCCCSWLGWCCLGRLMWRGKKRDGNDGRVEGGTVKRSKSMGCSMGCLWCLSSVQNVKVDVHDIEDNQVSVLITLTSPLSWYSEADDMPEKVKEYIRTEILEEPGREQCHTSKPSACFGFGCIAGSPDTRNEPPAGEQSHTSKPSTCFGFGCIAGSPDTRNEPPAGELRHTCKPSMHLGVGCKAGSPDTRNEPPVDYPAGAPKAQTKYNGNRNGQPKKRKSDKEIPLSIVGSSPPPSETSADEKTHMIPPTKGRALPVPANQHDPTSTGIGKSASPRLDPLTPDNSKMTSVERNSGAFPRKLPSPGQPPLDPIPSGKKS